jgi:hypothetical protein
MNSRLITLSLAMFGAIVIASPAQAQGHLAFASGPAVRSGAPPSRGGGGRTRIAPLRGARRFNGRSAYLPYFYPDYDSGPEIVEYPPDQIIEQSAEPAAPAPVRIPGDSLVIELQGDHWVRVTNNGQSEIGGESSSADSARQSNLRSTTPSAASRRISTAEPASEPPPAVLVFRDGHQEEISKYMISGATIYAGADYWSGGSWTQKVQIAELDVPATLKLNQERGARFSLPSGPDEVMIRP